jgi:hypothetical protein
LSFGTTWCAAGAISFVVPVTVAAWIYLLQGLVAMPAALLSQRLLAYPKASRDNPLTALALQLVFIQPVAFPAFLIVLDLAPQYVPAAFAAVVGAHFLPFSWLHKTNLYTALGIAVSASSFLLAAVVGRQSLHYTGFLVGGILLAGALLVRAHARALANAAAVERAA